MKRPILIGALCATAGGLSAAPLRWSEQASWKYHDRELALPWRTPGGDAAGPAVATLDLTDDNKPGWHEVRIPAGGADFLVRRTGGTNFVFSSREGENPPQFVLRSGRVLTPSADASLSRRTVKSLGTSKKLSTADGFLIRFDTAEAGTLRLWSTGAEFGDQRLSFHRPAIAPPRVAVPMWLKPDATVVASVDGEFMTREKHTRVRGGIATSSLPHPDLTWMSRLQPIPPQRQACVTVYAKLHADFRPGDGGKLPGLANTGQSTRDQAKTGWGGRKPDGVHWSARTGYGDWTDTAVGFRTYFYALEPKNLWGHSEPIGVTLPKGRWFAYVQCVKLNAPGRADGGLFYQLAGHPPSYARDDIRWRDRGTPDSLIRELWIDFYCGGTKCGQGPRGTVSFARAVVTRGLPDMRAVEAAVARMNAGGA